MEHLCSQITENEITEIKLQRLMMMCQLCPSCPHVLFCRDGGYETSPLIAKFCGSNRPPFIVSHSNRLWVKFHSDSAITYGGFTAHWDGTQTGEEIKGVCVCVCILMYTLNNESKSIRGNK